MKQYFGEATPKLGFGLMRLPKAVQDIFREADPKASFASWAIRYAASLEGIITVLSGMSPADSCY